MLEAGIQGVVVGGSLRGGYHLWSPLEIRAGGREIAAGVFLLQSKE